MSPSDSPYWESDRGEIVRWQSADDHWHDGAITSEADALETETYIVRIPTDEGDRFYTVHYPPTPDFDLDYEIDRIESEYGEDPT